MCDLEKKKQESGDNVEGKELIYFTTNFCSEFDSSDFFKPFGISLQPFNILWFPTWRLLTKGLWMNNGKTPCSKPEIKKDFISDISYFKKETPFFVGSTKQWEQIYTF